MHVEANGAGEPLSVVCVVVNWNGWQDTVVCLDALAWQEYPRLSVIVVDNGSTNGSAEQIGRAHPWVALLETGANLGFPGGCNAGIRLAYERGADLIWLLNNDTVAPPSTAATMVAVARANPRAGMIGSVLYYLDEPARVQAWGGGSVNLWTGFVAHYTAPASFAGKTTFFTGASVMLTRQVCEDVGIFSEGFFMYSDDTDLCLRIHQAGYTLVMAEDTAILHKEGASTPKRSPLVDEYTTLSTMRLLDRHARLPAVSIFVYLLLRVLNRGLRGRWSNLAAVARGIGTFRRDRSVSFRQTL